ncbi:hypothetical protein M413DRAFT_120224 [Hebeloma cylindrosporum]|uniref:BTB domain-containing protein n=1 Tax=Hebeloma cylindrosporum TaxID=76867 RepID=A0A0C2YNM2_HEBCY|nr:hypothetical protein M413DRAFT_120224 [Hebeloma cylindrosporum h7]
MEPSAKSEPSTNTSPTSIPIISATFCDPEADITFKSSDSVLFKIHRKYLEATSAGFTAPPFVETDHEVVLLQEPCEVLEILFRFIHPPTESQQYRQPAMMGVKPDVLFAVAEAAEKYLVFGAMNICLSRMDKIAEERPLEILNHCYKHGYDELADQVALHTIAFRLPVVAAKLTYPGLLQKWVRLIFPIFYLSSNRSVLIPSLFTTTIGWTFHDSRADSSKSPPTAVAARL